MAVDKAHLPSVTISDGNLTAELNMIPNEQQRILYYTNDL